MGGVTEEEEGWREMVLWDGATTDPDRFLWQDLAGLPSSFQAPACASEVTAIRREGGGRSQPTPNTEGVLLTTARRGHTLIRPSVQSSH